MAVNGSQLQSMAVNGSQWQSMTYGIVFCVTQWYSVAPLAMFQIKNQNDIQWQNIEQITFSIIT